MADKLPPGWVTAVRVLEYTGPAKWVEGTLNRGAVPIQGVGDFGGGFIKSGMVIWEAGETGELKKDHQPIIVAAPPGDGN